MLCLKIDFVYMSHVSQRYWQESLALLVPCSADKCMWKLSNLGHSVCAYGLQQSFFCDCVLVLFCNDLAITKYFITVPINHVAPRLIENMLSRFCTQLKTYLVPCECFKGAETVCKQLKNTYLEHPV